MFVERTVRIWDCDLLAERLVLRGGHNHTFLAGEEEIP